MKANQALCSNYVRLHDEFTRLLRVHERLINKTNSEPTFGEDENVVSARRVLFECRPLADWERSPQQP